MSARALAIFDLDGTITRRDSLLPYIAGYLWRHPRRLWRWALCLAPLLRFLLAGQDRGAFKASAIRLTLGGLGHADLVLWNTWFVPRLLQGGVFAEALERINAHRLEGAQLVLLSASVDLYVPEIARTLGFDRCLCTGVRWREDGRLDGALTTPNRRGEEKARLVAALLAEVQPARSYAYGNSDADLPHMRLVSEAVYVNGRAGEIGDSPHIRVEHWRTPGLALPVSTGHT